MKIIPPLLIFILFPLICSANNLEVYFSPNGWCMYAVISEINKAQTTIDVAMYYFTSREIAQALIKAKERHVEVRIILDKSQEEQSFSKSRYLLQRGFKVRYHTGEGLMHNKFVVIDGRVLITGSYNWTATAEKKNEENLIIIKDDGVIKQYAERFEYIWDGGRNANIQNIQGCDAFIDWFCEKFPGLCR